MEHQRLHGKTGTINNDNPILCWQGYTVDTTHVTDNSQWPLPFVLPDTLPPQYQSDTIPDCCQLLYATNWLFIPDNHHDGLHQTSPGFGDLSCTQSNVFETLSCADPPSLETLNSGTSTPYTTLHITPSDEDQWTPHVIFGTEMTTGQLMNCGDISHMESEPLGTCFETRAVPKDADNLARDLGAQNLTGPVLVHTDVPVTVPQQPWQSDALMPHQEQGPNHAARLAQPPVYGCTESPASTKSTLPSSLAGIQVQYLSESELKKNDLRRRNRMAASKARGLKKEVTKYESFGDPLIC
ncbi:uncharacterized protein PgNI_11560 [Pyricularia grisea]|uniref:BZIP domain-containing protein n=1 Tax=Pyricularia grisea TaxID=148305 RepID=A0A6P8AN86_PYRGI|nr:uncharacterized protein PgNI_11560 [Pyricularia grisea]TLD03503.1 hypothetical protein PgNI_11560 [Pyricularia grisea]